MDTPHAPKHVRKPLKSAHISYFYLKMHIYTSDNAEMSACVICKFTIFTPSPCTGHGHSPALPTQDSRKKVKTTSCP